MKLATPTHSESVVAEARERVADGYYNRPEVIDAATERVHAMLNAVEERTGNKLAEHHRQIAIDAAKPRPDKCGGLLGFHWSFPDNDVHVQVIDCPQTIEVTGLRTITLDREPAERLRDHVFEAVFASLNQSYPDDFREYDNLSDVCDRCADDAERYWVERDANGNG